MIFLECRGERKWRHVRRREIQSWQRNGRRREHYRGLVGLEAGGDQVQHWKEEQEREHPSSDGYPDRGSLDAGRCLLAKSESTDGHDRSIPLEQFRQHAQQIL